MEFGELGVDEWEDEGWKDYEGGYGESRRADLVFDHHLSSLGVG